MASSSLLKKYDAETAEVLDELIRESLRILLTVTSVIIWGWVAFAFLFIEHLTLPTITAMLVLLHPAFIFGYVEWAVQYCMPYVLMLDKAGWYNVGADREGAAFALWFVELLQYRHTVTWPLGSSANLTWKHCPLT